MNNMINWCMDNPSSTSGKVAYYVTKLRNEYYDIS